MKKQIIIDINGEKCPFSAPLSLVELIKNLDIGSRQIAVSINQDIIPHSLFDKTPVQDGDKIEIIHAVQGG